MQHYFGSIENGFAFLNKDEEHRLLEVKRAKQGEIIEISSEGSIFECEVVNLRPLKIKVKKKIEEKRENQGDLFIGFSLLKSDHNELIVLKGTELGVKGFYPFISERSIIRPTEKSDNKLLRLRKIAKEGAEQCRRENIPEVNDYLSFDEIIALEMTNKFIAYEKEAGKGQNLYRMIKGHENEPCLVLVGPEGGFSEEEVNKAVSKGFKPVSLGKRILRAETAAIYASIAYSLSLEEQ